MDVGADRIVKDRADQIVVLVAHGGGRGAWGGRVLARGRRQGKLARERQRRDVPRRVIAATRRVMRWRESPVPARRRRRVGASMLAAIAIVASAQSPDPVATPSIDMAGYLRIAPEAAGASRAPPPDRAGIPHGLARLPDTVILDARSREAFDALHVAGAIHLTFPDIAVASAGAERIPNRSTRILIYCNNNFVQPPRARSRPSFRRRRSTCRPTSRSTRTATATCGSWVARRSTRSDPCSRSRAHPGSPVQGLGNEKPPVVGSRPRRT